MKKELTWKEHIDRCSAMDISKKAYCEENNLSYQLFFYHQRKLMGHKPSAGFKEIILDEENDRTFQFSDNTDSMLKVQFANRSTLLFSEHLLERVFSLLQGPSQ